MSVSPVSHVCVTGSVSPFQCQGDKCQCHQCHVSVSQGQCPQCHSVTASVSQCVRVTVSVYPVPQCHHVSVTVSVSHMSVSQCRHVSVTVPCPQCHRVSVSVGVTVCQCHRVSVARAMSPEQRQPASHCAEGTPGGGTALSQPALLGDTARAPRLSPGPTSMGQPVPPPWDTQCHHLLGKGVGIRILGSLCVPTFPGKCHFWGHP